MKPLNHLECLFYKKLPVSLPLSSPPSAPLNLAQAKIAPVKVYIDVTKPCCPKKAQKIEQENQTLLSR